MSRGIVYGAPFFGAEARILVMRGFVDGYFSKSHAAKDIGNVKRDVKLALEIAQHFGIHIATVPWRYRWPQGDKLIECINLGTDAW
jgi:hypothetical protein